MQAKADGQGVVLRPHTKTHKCVKIARQQIDLGARGITVAKVGEAEIYVAAGLDDVRLAYTVVGQEKHERLMALMDGARISFCVDTPEGARAASEYYAAHGRRAEVLIEVDSAYGRCGVRWDQPDSLAFARYVNSLPGLRLTGILTHHGTSYNGPHEDETKEAALRRYSAEERDRMLAFAGRLAELPGIERSSFEISIGSTPSMRHFENRTVDGFSITEIRPGNYVFHDLTQVGLESADLKDCALTVLATVISKHRDPDGQERLFLDAGKKVLTSDGAYDHSGYGCLLYSARLMEPLPHAQITGLSEEHGWVKIKGGATLNVGDRVRLVPNHACVVVNTQDRLFVVDGEKVVDTWTVDAQGRVR